MTGLNVLDKKAADVGLQNNIKQLITDEAYEQISNKFPRLVPRIVGIDILEMIDDKTAVGAAVIMTDAGRILVPIIYTNGIVDATTFLYNEEFDTMLALTKKTVKFITEDAPGIEGQAVSDTSIKNVDPGNIRNLFIPPKTYSPKIASGTGGLLFAIAEQSPLVKTALAQKLTTDFKYRKVFADNYGKEAVDYIEKTAKAYKDYMASKDTTPPDTAFSIQELSAKDWMEKNAAFDEFGKYGYVISQGKFYPSKSLEKIATNASRLKKILGSDTLETIPVNKPGAFIAFDAVSLDPVPLVIYKDDKGLPFVFSKKEISFDDKEKLAASLSCNNSGDIYNLSNKDDYIIGQRVNVFDAGAIPLKLARKDRDRLKEDINHILFLKDGEIISGKRVFSPDIRETFSYIALNLGDDTAVIYKDSDMNYRKVGNIIYIGDAHVAILSKPDTFNRANAIKLLTNNNIDTQSTGEIVKVAYDAGDYYYNGSRYNLRGVVDALLKEGYDKYSIYTITKTAAENGEAAMAAVNAKLDMLSNMIMNLAGKIESVSSMVQGGQQPVEQPTMAQVESEQAAQEQAQDPQVQQLDQGTAADIGYAANQGTFDGQGVYGPMQQQPQDAGLANVDAQQPVPGDVQPQQEVPEGMNASIDPEVLQTLAQLKDSKVMDVGVLGTLGIDQEMSEIVASYRDDLLHGVSAIGRILFNMMVRREALSKQYGDGKYKKLVDSMKNIFIKTSDLYVEVTMMGVEANAQVGH